MDETSMPANVRLERGVGRQRLWIVRVVREAYVLAADEDEARDAQRDIERWEEYPKVEAEPWCGRELDGWDDRRFVYSRGDKAVSLPAAKRLDP